ncbi:MAG TPA: molecular chaperone TorD family protein [Bacteroidota bacterium]|nr:molecular chaperone TorD family protein [Bacteroidota bacterium]
MIRPDLFDCAAAALTYPGENFRESVRGLAEALGADPAGGRAADLVRAFEAETSRNDCAQLEELYTRTFDLTPGISLETGWQLYGESYERGSFLVKMRGMLRSLGIEEKGELPDHLSYMLMALGRLPVDEAGELVRKYLSKSLSKIIGNFTDAGNPYLKLLRTVSLVFEKYAIVKEDAHT